MEPKLFTRRDFSAGLAAVVSGLGVAGTTLGASSSLWAGQGAGNEEVTHMAEAIHQEMIFKASRKRVYEALTEAKEFDKVVQQSEAVRTGMVKRPAPAAISVELGGAFAFFGGFIVGRQLELQPNERIVQAWRVSYWNPGIYSIARFELAEQGMGTKLVFDHTGFPAGDGQHLLEGWNGNYWEPLGKYLAQQSQSAERR
jgi:activator of HSP90 ATPase